MNPAAQEAAKETMIQKAASATTTVAAGTAVVGGYTAQEILALGGLAVGVGSFALNWYYSHKRLKLLERQQEGEDADKS